MSARYPVATVSWRLECGCYWQEEHEDESKPYVRMGGFENCSIHGRQQIIWTLVDVHKKERVS